MQSLPVPLPQRVISDVPDVVDVDTASATTWKLVKWLVSGGQPVYHKQRTARFECLQTRAVAHAVAPHAGTLVKPCLREGDVITSAALPIAYVSFCPHSVVYSGVCAVCGEDVERPHYADDSALKHSRLAVAYNSDTLTVTRAEAESVASTTARMLYKSRSLSLVLDLDHTLVHATDDPRAAAILQYSPPNVDRSSVASFTLESSSLSRPPSVMHVKLRPHLAQFLSRVATTFQLHIYTMGSRTYADQIARLIDPDKTLFHGRITSREDFAEGRLNQKSIQRLFPCNDSMVLIVDDREDVWISGTGQPYMPNLIRACPYTFWNGPRSAYDYAIDPRPVDTKPVNTKLVEAKPHPPRPPIPHRQVNPAPNKPLTSTPIQVTSDSKQNSSTAPNEPRTRRRGPRRRFKTSKENGIKHARPTPNPPANPLTASSYLSLLFPNSAQSSTVPKNDVAMVCNATSPDLRTTAWPIVPAKCDTVREEGKQQRASSLTEGGRHADIGNDLKKFPNGEPDKTGIADETSTIEVVRHANGKEPAEKPVVRHGLNVVAMDKHQRQCDAIVNGKGPIELDCVDGVMVDNETDNKMVLDANGKEGTGKQDNLDEVMADSKRGKGEEVVANGNEPAMQMQDGLNDVAADNKSREQQGREVSADEAAAQPVVREAVAEECCENGEDNPFFKEMQNVARGWWERDCRPKASQHLLRLAEIMEECHSRFFETCESDRDGEESDKDEFKTTADVKQILADMRADVLHGCTITFTGVVPLGADPLTVPIWNLALRLGAKCELDFVVGKTTHLVASDARDSNTQKCEHALKSGCAFVVTTKWLEHSALNFQREVEFDYRVAIDGRELIEEEYQQQIHANFTQCREDLEHAAKVNTQLPTPRDELHSAEERPLKQRRKSGPDPDERSHSEGNGESNEDDSSGHGMHILSPDEIDSAMDDAFDGAFDE